MTTPTKDDHKRYLEVLAHLLLADFQVTEDEHEFLVEVAERLALSDEELHEVIGRVNIGTDVGPVASALPTALHAALLEDLEVAAVCDGELAAREQAVLKAVRAALRT